MPAPPLVVAHYVTEAAAEQTSVGKNPPTRMVDGLFCTSQHSVVGE